MEDNVADESTQFLFFLLEMASGEFFGQVASNRTRFSTSGHNPLQGSFPCEDELTIT
jgi:hypothetical protein